jgi:hypothetical protein
MAASVLSVIPVAVLGPPTCGIWPEDVPLE